MLATNIDISKFNSLIEKVEQDWELQDNLDAVQQENNKIVKQKNGVINNSF